MAWVAVDRLVQDDPKSECHGPATSTGGGLARDDPRRGLRKGFDAERNTFLQSYGGRAVDASLLQIPIVGFLPPDDPRVVGTVDAVLAELSTDAGLVLRYRTDHEVDGLPGDEGAFLACSFWLVEALHLIGRRDEARDRFAALLSLRNDLGLLAEEYDPRIDRMVGTSPSIQPYPPGHRRAAAL